ncbi:MAG TPA: type II toxin-antitoxin system VapC family toxin [Thermomicrobiales bacterium]|nr:type II toxin-antitoxin system VapC family toxin [Thermomicrobiales bacterium]
MRRYLLDTGSLAALLLGRPAAVELIRPWLERREAATSILVYGEIIEYLRPRPDCAVRVAALRQILRGVPPYFLTYPIMDRYADVRLRLRKPHGPGLIGDADTLIAATALERGLAVVTIDKDFQAVPNLMTLLLDRETLRVVGA